MTSHEERGAANACLLNSFIAFSEHVGRQPTSLTISSHPSGVHRFATDAAARDASQKGARHVPEGGRGVIRDGIAVESNPSPLLHRELVAAAAAARTSAIRTRTVRGKKRTWGSNACDHRTHHPVRAPDLLKGGMTLRSVEVRPSACYLFRQMHDEKPPRRQAGQREARDLMSLSKPAGLLTTPVWNR